MAVFFNYRMNCKLFSFKKENKKILEACLKEALRRRYIVSFDFITIEREEFLILCFLTEAEKFFISTGFFNFLEFCEQKLGKSFKLGLIEWNSLHIYNEQKEKYSLLLEQILPIIDDKEDARKRVYDEFKKLKDNNPNLNPTELIITDPYLFPKNCESDYLSFLEDLFKYIKKLFPSLEKIKVIISPYSLNKHLKTSLESILRKMNLTLKVQESKDFHDRFWIFYDDNKQPLAGIVIGTSLNGIGKRISLVKTLDSNELKELHKFLVDQEFI